MASVQGPGICFSPPNTLNPEFIIWPALKPIHRIHDVRFSATQFNDTKFGNARFSPIRNADELIIPTLYGGSTFDCAAMETVFHNVPYTDGVKTVRKTPFVNYAHSVIASNRNLKLADLSSVGLLSLNISNNQLIDTEQTQYPKTREWAEKLHESIGDCDGLQWMSRRDNRAEAVVLFGDRISLGTLSGSSPSSQNIFNDAPTANNLFTLSKRIRVLLI